MIWSKTLNDNKGVCVISDGFPTKENPINTFVEQLICALADLGVKCSVIAPQSVTRSLIRKNAQNPTHWTKRSKTGQIIDVYQPKYVSMSGKKVCGVDIGKFLFERAAIHAFTQIKDRPNIMYGHFWHCGLIAAKIAKKERLPVYVACGESRISILDDYKLNKIKPILSYINGVISVSSENKINSIKFGLADQEKIVVLPNGIDNSIFYKMNKNEARASLGYDNNDFIVAFTGAFSDRKGSKRLSEALDKVENVKSIFIGKGGTHIPNCNSILFCGQLAHEDIARYLNSADIFVLPTLAEGCCNAIIEALACGLPVISSKMPFNDDILDDSYAIRVNPQSIEDISDAILLLKNNPKMREKMSQEALNIAKKFTIEERAKRVLDYICM